MDNKTHVCKIKNVCSQCTTSKIQLIKAAHYEPSCEGLKGLAVIGLFTVKCRYFISFRLRGWLKEMPVDNGDLGLHSLLKLYNF